MTCWLSVRLASRVMHTQGFNVTGEGNLGASDSRCGNQREVAKTLSGAKQNGLRFAAIKGTLRRGLTYIFFSFNKKFNI